MDSTKVFVDSIKAVVSYTSEMPVQKHEWYNNWTDVLVVAIVAITIYKIVFICINGYKEIKEQEINAQNKSENAKKEWEAKEKQCKTKAELKVKKLDFLKELCYEEIQVCEVVCEEEIATEVKEVKNEKKESESKKKCEKKEKKLRAIDSEAVKAYLKELEL